MRNLFISTLIAVTFATAGCVQSGTKKISEPSQNFTTPKSQIAQKKLFPHFQYLSTQPWHEKSGRAPLGYSLLDYNPQNAFAYAHLLLERSTLPQFYELCNIINQKHQNYDQLFLFECTYQTEDSSPLSYSYTLLIHNKKWFLYNGYAGRKLTVSTDGKYYQSQILKSSSHEITFSKAQQKALENFAKTDRIHHPSDSFPLACFALGRVGIAQATWFQPRTGKLGVVTRPTLVMQSKTNSKTTLPIYPAKMTNADAKQSLKTNTARINDEKGLQKIFARIKQTGKSPDPIGYKSDQAFFELVNTILTQALKSKNLLKEIPSEN